jgi:lipid-binding SYLF domain-containing protein
MFKRRLSQLLLSFFVFATTHTVWAGSAAEIDQEVDQVLVRFKTEVGGGDKLLRSADAVLVFPSVLKAGFGIGGEYGEGALRISGKSVAYYSTAAASIGFQIGAQSKAVIIVFLDNKALASFRHADGWEVGVDGSVALVEVGIGGSIDSTNIKDPVIGFVLTNAGLMFNLTLEGSKFTKLDK